MIVIDYRSGGRPRVAKPLSLEFTNEQGERNMKIQFKNLEEENSRGTEQLAFWDLKQHCWAIAPETVKKPSRKKAEKPSPSKKLKKV